MFSFVVPINTIIVRQQVQILWFSKNGIDTFKENTKSFLEVLNCDLIARERKGRRTFQTGQVLKAWNMEVWLIKQNCLSFHLARWLETPWRVTGDEDNKEHDQWTEEFRYILLTIVCFSSYSESLTENTETIWDCFLTHLTVTVKSWTILETPVLKWFFCPV